MFVLFEKYIGLFWLLGNFGIGGFGFGLGLGWIIEKYKF